MQFERAYTFIGIYWLVIGLLNQYNWVQSTNDNELQAQLLFLRNFFGIHLALIIFIVYSKGKKRKSILLTLLAFVFFETLMMVWNGIENDSNVIIIGIGSLIVMVYSIVGLIEYINEIYHSPLENAMSFISAAFLFAYGSITMTSVLNVLRIASPTDPNESFLYYVGLLISALLSCFGLWRYAEAPSFYKGKK
ncbi:MAG: hypothetical protein JST13_01665 [Bacteroidetes bacterium]|nr:hypothetical protein [Bacteroidota bacterium]